MHAALPASAALMTLFEVHPALPVAARLTAVSAQCATHAGDGIGTTDGLLITCSALRQTLVLDLGARLRQCTKSLDTLAVGAPLGETALEPSAIAGLVDAQLTLHAHVTRAGQLVQVWGGDSAARFMLPN